MMHLHLSACLAALSLAGCTQLPAPPPLASVATAFAQCPQFFPEGKPPVVPDAPELRELCYTAFAILHSGLTKTPVFVAEHLDRAMIKRAREQKRSEHFFADARLPAAERSELADYRDSGYSRGHMAPAGDMSTPMAMAQSFSLANMVPQNQPFNEGAWLEIEQSTRKYVLRAQADVYVFTGPVFAANPPTIGPGKVHVPSHLFKLVYDPCSGKSWAHWLANAATTRPLPPISYDELVRRTGIRFLPPATPSNQAAARCGRRATGDGPPAHEKKPRLHVQSGS